MAFLLHTINWPPSKLIIYHNIGAIKRNGRKFDGYMQPFKQPIPVGRKKSLSNHGYSSIKAYIVFLQEMDKRTEDSMADKDSFSSKRAP